MQPHHSPNPQVVKTMSGAALAKMATSKAEQTGDKASAAAAWGTRAS